MNELIEQEEVQNRIYKIRGQRVMLGPDLASLYKVKTKALMQSIRRNIERFPRDFAFQLSDLELKMCMISRSQIVTLKHGKNIKYLPYAFTEQGIAMLSSVLNSKHAIQVNIAIMRAFVKLRHALSQNKAIAQKIERLEGKVDMHETDIRLLINDVCELKEKPATEKSPNVKGFTP